MKKLRVGVIGVGYLGKFHAEKYARMDNAELVGVVDTNRITADSVAKQLQTQAFADYQDLLDQIDAVSIVVPTPLHFDISHQCLERDIDVMIEKPMTTTLKEADRLIDVAETRGLIIQVGHLERFNPAVVALRDIIKTPMFIEAHRLSFYKPRGTDVSVVLDLMIHDIDIIASLVRSEIKAIHAAGIPIVSDHVDIANARLEFKNGCVANVTASRISTKNERKIRLFQRDSYISVDFANHTINIIDQSGQGEASDVPGLNTRQLHFDKADALDDELKAFVHSVIKREAPEVSGKVGRNALSVALNIMDQIQTTSNRWYGR